MLVALAITEGSRKPAPLPAVTGIPYVVEVHISPIPWLPPTETPAPTATLWPTVTPVPTWTSVPFYDPRWATPGRVYEMPPATSTPKPTPTPLPFCGPGLEPGTRCVAPRKETPGAGGTKR
jgi:hypothetical protein